MAKFKVVPPDDYKVLQKYLEGERGVVLIPMEVVAQLDSKTQAALASLNHSGGGEAPYNFGGEADVLVDIVTDIDHSALTALLENYEHD